MKIIYIFVIYFTLCDVICPIEELTFVENVSLDWEMQMNSVIYKSINKYYCTIGNYSGINLITYGTNAWTFPMQDVNLTLRYPTTTLVHQLWNDHLIAGFQVVLYVDSLSSNGYITEGGMLRESITLSFTSSQVTMMRYQFWVYGIRKESVPNLANYSSTRLCN